jgi:hypothetical protein
MKLTSRVTERAPGETEVVASSELEVTGLLAQMGRGMVQDVGDQIFRKFTDAMRAELEAPAPAAAAPAPAPAEPAESAESAEPAEPASGGPAARVQVPAAQVAAAASAASAAHSAGPAQPPIDVLSMGAGAAARAAGRSLRRPAAWLALAVFVFLVFWLLGRARP